MRGKLSERYSGATESENRKSFMVLWQVLAYV